jgi:ribonuclease HI
MLIRIYTDGASRGNPGKSASGYSISDAKGKLIYRNVEYNGIATNNVAEYNAVINALRKVIDRLGPENDIELFSDSKLVVNQINGKYRIRDKRLQELNSEVMVLLNNFNSYSVKDVPRETEGIVAVDRELNLFLDRI